MAADDSGNRTVYTPDTAAAPQPSNLYVGAVLGQGRADIGLDLSNTGNLSFGGLVGYQFTRNLAAEVSYINLGKITTTTGISGTTTGVGAAAIASTPINRSVSLFGKFGVASLTTAWDSSPDGIVNSTQTATGLNWGAGLNIEAAKSAVVRIGLDHYVIGSDASAAGNVTNMAIGLLLKF